MIKFEAKMILVIILIVILLSFNLMINSEETTVPFNNITVNGQNSTSSQCNTTYGGEGYDEAFAIVQTDDGGFSLAGASNLYSYGSIDQNIFVVKTDNAGCIQWEKIYYSNASEEALAILQLSDGSYIIGGATELNDLGGKRSKWLGKTNSFGEMEWIQTYGPKYNLSIDHISSRIVLAIDGGFAFIGNFYRSDSFSGGINPWLFKTDAIGNMLWNVTYGSNKVDKAQTLIQTLDEGYALAGSTNSFGPDRFSDMWLIKTDKTGIMMWNKTYGGSIQEGARTLVQTTDGGFALAGYTNSFGAGANDMWLVKTDAAGNMLWNKTYGGYQHEAANALVQTADGGFALAGYTNSFSREFGDMWLVRTDETGNMLWNKTFGGNQWEQASALIQITGGGFALAGYTNSFGAGANDMWLVITDDNGFMGWNDPPTDFSPGLTHYIKEYPEILLTIPVIISAIYLSLNRRKGKFKTKIKEKKDLLYPENNNS